MNKKITRPKWWLLYCIVAVAIGLFWAAARSTVSKGSRTWIEVGLLMFLYWLVISWLKANESAFISINREEYRKLTADYKMDSVRLQPTYRPNPKVPGFLPDPDHQQMNLPAWVVSLAAVIIALFKAQDG